MIVVFSAIAFSQGQSSVKSTPNAAASESSIVLRAYCDKQTIFIGDDITFTVEVEHNDDIAVETVEPPQELGQFEIKDAKEPKDEKLENGKILKKKTYTLSTYISGNYEIPSFTIKYREKNGAIKEAKSSTIAIVVKSVSALSSDKGDIRDVKPPVVMPVDNTVRNIIIAAVIAGLIAIIYGILYYRRWKRLRLLRGEEYLGPPRPIDEVALEQLDKIAQAGLLDKNLIKQYYTEIMDVIRTYISKRYNFDALDRTTSELFSILNDKDIEKDNYAIIGSFFIDGDLVKFAKYIPPRAECERFIDEARTIVTRTTPIIQPIEPIENIPSQSPEEVVGVGAAVSESSQSSIEKIKGPSSKEEGK